MPYNLLFILLFLFIGLLIYYSVLIYNSNKEITYPGNLSKCPDFYILKQENCLAHSSIYNVDEMKEKCKIFNYSSPLYKYNTPTSHCNKKKWTKDCNVLWDGITDQEDLYC